MQNKVLILLSSYNGSCFIEEQIKSLEQQKNVDVHILVRDDGSKDDTVSILKRLALQYDNITLLAESNIGCAQSFSKLLLKASEYTDYEYFAFCDQDDWWLEDKLSKAIGCLACFDRNQQNLYCSNLWIVDKDLNNKKLKYKKDYVKLNKPSSLVESYGTGCTFLFNRAVVDFYCTHIPEVLHLHDIWIYHQCLFLGNVYYDDNSYILYRQHGNNVVGAVYGFKARLTKKINSYKQISLHHEREEEAKQILKSYQDFLPSEIKKSVVKVAGYNKNIFTRLGLCFSVSINRKNLLDNLALKIRILKGCI